MQPVRRREEEPIARRKTAAAEVPTHTWTQLASSHSKVEMLVAAEASLEPKSK